MGRGAERRGGERARRTGAEDEARGWMEREVRRYRWRSRQGRNRGGGVGVRGWYRRLWGVGVEGCRCMGARGEQTEVEIRVCAR